MVMKPITRILTAKELLEFLQEMDDKWGLENLDEAPIEAESWTGPKPYLKDIQEITEYGDDSGRYLIGFKLIIN